MKGVLVIIDGLADRACRLLGEKTPLEAAKKPNLDYFSENGELGYIYPVHETFVPGTSEAIVSLFAQNWEDYPRGWLEAIGEGIELEKGDFNAFPRRPDEMVRGCAFWRIFSLWILFRIWARRVGAVSGAHPDG